MSTLDNLLKKITYTRLATILLVVAAIPLIYPFGLPIPISPETDAFKAEIDKLEPGSIIAIGWQMASISGLKGSAPGYRVITKYLAQQGMKAVYVCVSDVSPIAAEDTITGSGVETTYGWTYGEDFVISSYIPGEETALASFARDVQGTLAADYYGTPVANLPLMEGLRTMNDFDLMISFFGTFTFADMYARQWGAEYPDVPWIAFCQFGTVTAYFPELVKGALDLDRGGAEFEVIVNMPGVYSSRMDARNFYGFTLIILMILGNIAYYQTAGFRKRVGAGFERAFFKEEQAEET
jgi:hypothetical protein